MKKFKKEYELKDIIPLLSEDEHLSLLKGYSGRSKKI